MSPRRSSHPPDATYWPPMWQASSAAVLPDYEAPPDMAWQARALCADDEAFDDAAAPPAYCSWCPVRAACEDFGRATKASGAWGGRVLADGEDLRVETPVWAADALALLPDADRPLSATEVRVSANRGRRSDDRRGRSLAQYAGAGRCS